MQSEISWQKQGAFTDIVYEKADGIARVTINRPSRRNAFTPDTIAEMLKAFADARDAEALGIALPLFVVTMASQNLPGFAVMRGAGFEPPVRPALTVTGLLSAVSAFFAAHTVNMAAITAAICAGPDAHPDPARRWIAACVAGAGYVVLGLLAGAAAAVVSASPPVLIEAVAGLAEFAG